MSRDSRSDIRILKTSYRGDREPSLSYSQYPAYNLPNHYRASTYTPSQTSSGSSIQSGSPFSSGYSSPYPYSSKLPELGFGIEIEAVVAPRRRHPGWSPAKYYELLAMAIRSQGLPAIADSCTSSYSKHPEHYSKWFITSDGSLSDRPGCISLEAVSPKIDSVANWEEHIKLFWKALDKVFTVIPDISCGAHIHIAPIGGSYTLDELKKIAFAVCYYEALVYALLPAERHNNVHCQRNSKVALRLDHLLGSPSSSSLRKLAGDIKSKRSSLELCYYMQGDELNRKVLWNFRNTITGVIPPSSGTIEFRGGRHLRGPVRTLRWIAFAVVFVSMALDEDLLNAAGPYDVPGRDLPLYEDELMFFWKKLWCHASKLQMSGHIPTDYKIMNETRV